jgi:hypothetical protein
MIRDTIQKTNQIIALRRMTMRSNMSLRGPWVSRPFPGNPQMTQTREKYFDRKHRRLT